jgi:hypothetical protein
VIGFDLAGFFERHSEVLRAAVQNIVEELLGNAETIQAE